MIKLERSKNAIRNASFGLIEKMVTILLPFILRTVVIKCLGADYLGLNSLFTSILSVLNMTELGFSSAIVFSMYKPIAQNDGDTINALLNFYKNAYKIVGIIILVVGLLFIPFLNVLVNGSYPDSINLVVVYCIFLVNTAISYFLFAYLQVLITAHQRDDAISKVNIIISTIMYVTQIIILVVFRNYYLYIITMPIFTIINNIRTAIVAKKLFPQYKPKGKISKAQKNDIKEKISGLMIQKICTISRNSFDSIYVSMFLGLTETAMYNNYYYIINAVTSIMVVFTNAITAGVGNSVAVEETNKNFEDFKNLDFLYMWIAGWCTCCLLVFFQPFMNIWVGEELMLPFGCVILFCVYFYVLKTGDVRTIYSTANGLWWKNRYRSIAEALSNIILNYALGKMFGIYGIILATVLTIVLVNFIYGGQLIFKYYFINNKKSEYFGRHTLYFCVSAIVTGLTYIIAKVMPYNILGFLGKLVICIFVPNVLFWIIYRKTKAFQTAVPWIVQRLPLKSLKLRR